ncbi:MAG TPA: helix-turn-helix domain-containing protein [Nitrososphaera sp.]|jgi:sugar-specific transcriptional regulator TrmB|nr:helix-turn-helix domain-containing protein [Nitrososphaera sp.]
MLNDSNSDLPGSLEEFGLSKYEARAYLTMIGKGSLAASEIAYYANLPRTKIYQTVKKLEKKRLAVISKQKPLICSAIPPEEAFAEIVNLHERRVKNMKKIVDRLQKINDEGQRPKGSEERRYFILDANSALEKIGNLVANSRSSITATLDPWGLRLLSQCRPSLVRAVTNDVQVRLVLGAQCIVSEGISSLPEGIELRVADGAPPNLIIVDSTHMVSVDSSNGKAALFASVDSFGTLQSKNFEEAWSKAGEIKPLLGAEPAVAMKAIELARIVENGLSARILEYAVSSADVPAELVDLMEEKYGFKMAGMGAAEVMGLVDSALKISCLGSLKHDRNNNIVSLQSKVDSKHVLPWALVLASYFKRAGNEPRIMQQSRQAGAQLVHLRLAKPIS